VQTRQRLIRHGDSANTVWKRIEAAEDQGNVKAKLKWVLSQMAGLRTRKGVSQRDKEMYEDLCPIIEAAYVQLEGADFVQYVAQDW
jgi:hypothetical protein